MIVVEVRRKGCFNFNDRVEVQLFEMTDNWTSKHENRVVRCTRKMDRVRAKLKGGRCGFKIAS